MTKQFATAGVPLARCSRCDSDLYVPAQKPDVVVRKERRYFKGESNGSVYCSNGRCKHAKSPHPTGSTPNDGKK